MAVSVGGEVGYSILAVNWTLAIIGVIMEFVRWKPFRQFSLVLYLFMGWLCIIILPRMIASVPH